MKKNWGNNWLKTCCLLTVILASNNLYGLESMDQYNNTIIIVEDGNGLDLKENKNITNNGVISYIKSDPNSPYPIWNGIFGDKNYGIGNVINNGIVSVSLGNAIYSENGIKNIANEGFINSFEGNAIKVSNPDLYIDKEFINLIDNSGIIKGHTSEGWQGGNGVTSRLIEEVINNGVIKGYSSASGRSSYSGNSIFSSYGSIGNINNEGTITGYSNSANGNSGNGIIISGEDAPKDIADINNVTNVGIISGYATHTDDMTAQASGNGIIVNKDMTHQISRIKEIINNGTISGYSNQSHFNSGNGIATTTVSNFDDPTSGNIETIINQGLIKGSNQAIKGNVTSLTNNGILAGKEITDKDQSFVNNGITIQLNSDGSGTISKITNGKEGIVTLEDKSIKTIINGTINGVDSSLNSSSLTKK